MAMGHHELCKNGDELDCFSQKTKRHMGETPGRRSYIKAKFNRRVRREVKYELRCVSIEIEFYEPESRGWWIG